MIRGMKISQFLNVRYEDWTHDYDTYMRKIFSHLLGSDHPSIDGLVIGATQFDLNRASEEDIAHNDYVSDEDEKHRALEVLGNLYMNNEKCTQVLANADERMGYEIT